jgi:hypothetical protein
MSLNSLKFLSCSLSEQATASLEMRKAPANFDLRLRWLGFSLGMVIPIRNLAQIDEGQK